MIKISIITATYNSIQYLPDLLDSIRQQDYRNYEHIVVDGGSTDGTLEYLRASNRVDHLISERDTGLYDALNKGIKLASGNVIGFLHSDDVFASSQSLQLIRDAFATPTCMASGEYRTVDVVYGDLVYIDPLDTNRVLRNWVSRPFNSHLLKRGWMPAHPTVFMHRNVYLEHGLYNEELKIAADYDLLIRVFKDQFIHSSYIPRVITKMRMGGVSNKGLHNLVRKSWEDYLVIKKNGLPLPLWILLLKNISKLPQLVVRTSRVEQLAAVLKEPEG